MEISGRQKLARDMNREVSTDDVILFVPCLHWVCRRATEPDLIHLVYTTATNMHLQQIKKSLWGPLALAPSLNPSSLYQCSISRIIRPTHRHPPPILQSTELIIIFLTVHIIINLIIIIYLLYFSFMKSRTNPVSNLVGDYGLIQGTVPAKQE
jgi:hypothetical protein